MKKVIDVEKLAMSILSDDEDDFWIIYDSKKIVFILYVVNFRKIVIFSILTISFFLVIIEFFTNQNFQ